MSGRRALAAVIAIVLAALAGSLTVSTTLLPAVSAVLAAPRPVRVLVATPEPERDARGARGAQGAAIAPGAALAAGASADAERSREPGWSYRLRLPRALERARMGPPAAEPATGAVTAAPARPARLVGDGDGDRGGFLGTRPGSPSAGPVGGPVGGAGGRPASGTARRTATVAPTATPVPEPTVAPEVPSGKVLNVLLMGSDKRPGDGNWRTDTLVLVSIDADRRRVGMLSVPRDLWVDIPGHGSGRINTADFLGQLAGRPDGALIKETVAANLGVPVDRFVRVNFQAFVGVVDALGGIELVVDCPIEDYFLSDGVAGPGPVSLDTGVHHVDGTTALRYARSRHSTSDFDRSRRQQRVLRAMVARAREKGLLRSAPRLLASVREHVQTDLSLPELLGLGLLAARTADVGVRSAQLDFHQLSDWTTPDGAQVLLADPAAVATLLAEVVARPDAQVAAVPAGQVALIDRTGRPGWDRVATMRLAEARIPASVARSAGDGTASAVYHRPDAESLALAVAEALDLPAGRLLPMDSLPATDRLGSQVQVLLTDDWAPDCP
jgi:LCP family protein required for cell wall assembly